MNDRSSDTHTLNKLLIAKSVKRGSFILASGKSSNIYIDARLTTMSPEGMVLIGKLGLEIIRQHDWKPDAVGGLTMGADPVSFSISHTSALQNNPVRAFSVRKEVKEHGTGNRIEDVITTGRSAIQAIDAIEFGGGRILGVLAVVDREDGGREAIAARGYEALALTSISSLTG